jgi:hypothetical protein
MILVLSFIFAFMLGFSAHRAGICTVAAVAEVITSRTARTFSSFFKVVLWVLLINGIAALLAPGIQQPYTAPVFSIYTIAGGLLFGIGASINGGCSFSTISKIAQGDLHFALTLPAFILGAISAREFSLGRADASGSLYAIDFSDIPLILLAGILLWALLELFLIIRSVVTAGIVKSVTGKRYRLSSAAALIGLSSGFLYIFQGRWAYSSKILDHFAVEPAPPFIGTTAFYLLLALLAGAVISALSNRQFKASFAGNRWYRNMAGGFLMGLGAMLVPGGNGMLILHDLPHLSLQAAIAYMAMVSGITLTLLMEKRLFGRIDVVSCAGDKCTLVKS